MSSFAIVSVAFAIPVLAPATPALAATPVTTATLVRMIDTSKWSPASPDPSGIVYLPGSDRMQVADSEVDETTGAGYHNVNMWTLNRTTGAVVDEGTTWTPVGFSKEPTGLGYMAPTNTLLISDDSKRYVWIEQAGADGRFGTTDDTRTFINAGAWGSTDTEDPEYLNGHIFYLDGKGTEIYDIGPGNDGKFGTSDDTMSHFDIGHLGPTDWEGLSSNPFTGNLLVGARAKKMIYELTPTGTLVQTIDASKITGMKYLSGLAYAPASNGNGWDYWIVDRAVDNNQVPTENDGKLWEVTTSTSTTDTPPTVTVSSPKAGDTVSGTVTVSASANDDHGVSQVQFFVDGSTSIGTDTNGTDGWSVQWDTTKAGDGAHTLTAEATDTANQTTTSAGVGVTVSNTAVDNPPSVSITSPKTGDKVRGTVNVTANASDDHGVTQVRFLDGGTTIGTDTNGSDGWSVPWDTTKVADGSHTLTAEATDTAAQTATSAGQAVTVDNTAPTVSIASPTGGATVSGTVSVIASADDAGGTGVASVQFFNDGASIGSDTNGADGWSVSWNTSGTPNGGHTLTARATDAAGNQTTSAGVGVTVSNTGTTGSIDDQIAAYTDDVEQQLDGTVGKSSADLDMMNDGTTVQAAVGLRFTNVAIPQGATITGAWVQFWPNEKRSDATTLSIQADASDNSAVMSSKNNLTSRTLTSAKVTWVPPSWTTLDVPGPEAQTPNIASVIQEIVSRGGWVSGNALGIIITGSGRRVAEAYDANPAWAPLLHVDYTVP
ncbi:MAG: Ig-like domain-containing protein [Planctomycetaceae bacterium]